MTPKEEQTLPRTNANVGLDGGMVEPPLECPGFDSRLSRFFVDWGCYATGTVPNVLYFLVVFLLRSCLNVQKLVFNIYCSGLRSWLRTWKSVNCFALATCKCKQARTDC
jgi:hypothetical protein